MERRPSQESLEEHLLNPNAIGPERPSPQAFAVDHGQVAFPPTTPQRYPMRTIVLIFVPLAITGYFYFVWQYFLERDFDDAVKYGVSMEIWVYYSWFIIGVLCLDWARYGLVGVEAAMLQSPWFQLPHLVGLMSHSESTWNGPGGWMRCLKRFVNSGDAPAGREGWLGLVKTLLHAAVTPSDWVSGLKRLALSFKTYKLWYLLAFLSLSLYIGLPLSGLTMELSDGYVRLDERPMVVGRTKQDFDNREFTYHYFPTIETMWKMGSPAILPGIGVIYTPKHLKRDDFPGFAETPNTLPMESGIPEMFLAPQAKVPVSGRAWGLRAGYKCSIVEDISEFELLTQKSSKNCSTMTDASPCITTVFHKSENSDNVWAYAEIGVRTLLATVYNGTERFSFEPVGASEPHVVEYAMWQVRRNASYVQNEGFNNTLSPVIRGMSSPFMRAENGSWAANLTYFDAGNTDSVTKSKIIKTFYEDEPGSMVSIMEIALPIGVRCVATSTVGTAELNPGSSTFDSFEQVAPVPISITEAEESVPFLGHFVSKIMAKNYLAMFSSVNSRAVRAHSNSVSYNSFIQPQDLKKSFLVAYGMETLQLMYDGKYGFEGSWLSNLTSSKEGKILTKGELSPLWSVIPFGIWTVGSLVLAIFYGFRKRWVESLDGFSFFRFGVYLAGNVNASSKLYNSKEAHEVEGLWSLPGVVGKT